MTAPYLPQRHYLTSPDRAGVDGVLPVFAGQKFLAKKAPVWSTDVFTSRSGRRWASSNWLYPIWRWAIPYEFLRRLPERNELGRLYAFFNQRYGRASEFLYLDPDDNAVVDEPIGLGDGATAVFQLTRSLEGWVEPVTALNGVPVVMVNGVQTSAMTVSDQGLVTFAVPPAASARISWTGGYLFRCVFTADSIEPAQAFRSVWALSQLEFETFK